MDHKFDKIEPFGEIIRKLGLNCQAQRTHVNFRFTKRREPYVNFMINLKESVRKEKFS